MNYVTQISVSFIDYNSGIFFILVLGFNCHKEKYLCFICFYYCREYNAFTCRYCRVCCFMVMEVFVYVVNYDLGFVGIVSCYVLFYAMFYAMLDTDLM